MDAYEATKVVLTRIQALDPENAPKIMGRLLTQDNGDKDMIRLAFGPDSTLHTLVLKARNDMGLHRQTASPRLPPTSPSAWAPPPHFSRNEDLISPINQPCGPPLYGDLADEVQISDVFYQGQHRRTCSAADVCLVSEASGWRPCVYFARGYCKNGSTCRFLHADDTSVDAAVAATPELLRSRSQLMASAYPYSPTSPSAKSLNLFLQHQNETQRAAAALLLGEDEGRTFIGRPRIERTEFAAAMLNPGSRQIYLTFPADSTFREEDVSNYFSIYGPVQDVRIPYQQKRMFGFVTFLYTETVKLILAKGNPHFVCDARVLVKPYKEKGKVPDKFRKQQQVEREDVYDQWSGARMQEVLLRRKLELQQAIELQGRRFSGLHLLDLETRSLSSPTNGAGGFYPRSVFSTPEQSPSPEDKSPSPPATGAPALSLNGGFLRQVLVNGSAAEIEESAGDVCNQEEGSSFEQSVELNLPDSPFASPTRASSRRGESFSMSSSASEADLLAGSPDSDSSSCSNHSNLIDMNRFKACFLPIRQAAPY